VDPVRAGLAGLAAIAALVLAISMFSDVVQVQGVHGHVIVADSGYDRHGLALPLLIVAVLALTVLALRGVRVAAAGVGLMGVVVLLLAILGDVPDLDRHAYADLGLAAVTGPGSGFYLETLAGVLLLLAGGGLWLTTPPQDDRGATTAAPAR
jgi:hypothetical protein